MPLSEGVEPSIFRLTAECIRREDGYTIPNRPIMLRKPVTLIFTCWEKQGIFYLGFEPKETAYKTVMLTRLHQ